MYVASSRVWCARTDELSDLVYPTSGCPTVSLTAKVGQDLSYLFIFHSHNLWDVDVNNLKIIPDGPVDVALCDISLHAVSDRLSQRQSPTHKPSIVQVSMATGRVRVVLKVRRVMENYQERFALREIWPASVSRVQHIQSLSLTSQ
jgi:hypothetical protein